MRKFTVQTPESVRMALLLPDNTQDHFLLLDSVSELADYAEKHAGNTRQMTEDSKFRGRENTREALRMAREGDLRAVSQSDALLEKFERFQFQTSRKAWLDDVTGALPNVPAFIAGHPLNMRRRTRDDSAFAPIAIVADLSSSAAIPAQKLVERGAAILALVRIIAQRRPVELWVGTTLDANNCRNSCSVYFRIETAPLDLATAAHALTHPSIPRRFCYGIGAAQYGFEGRWPYDKAGDHRGHAEAIFAPAFQHVTKTLFIPATHSRDNLSETPDRWIEARLQEAAADFAAAA